MERKSQSAMEFLMSYGWAFLIVLIIIASLIYFGVLKPEQYLPDKVELKQGLDIIDATVDENSISFILRNDLGRNVYDFQVNATECNNGAGELSTAVDVPEGKTKKVIIYCDHDYEPGSKIESGLKASWNTKVGSKGQNFDFDHATTGVVNIMVNTGKSLYDRVDVNTCDTLNQTKTIYNFTNALNATGHCFNITSDNVIIEGNGLNLTGNGSENGITVIGKNNITIRNFGNIGNFTSGIYIEDTNNSRIENNTMKSNLSATGLEYYTMGIYMKAANSNIIRNNVIEYNSSVDDMYSYGIYHYIASGKEGGNNNFTENTFRMSSEYEDVHGIYINIYGLSESNLYENNTFILDSSIRASIGIRLYVRGGSSNYSTVKGNSINLNATTHGSGIMLENYIPTKSLNISNNILNINGGTWGYGIRLTNYDILYTTDFHNNNIWINSTSTSYGIQLDDLLRNTINNNIINTTSSDPSSSIISYGVKIRTSDETNITSNSINTSAQNAESASIYLDTCDDNYIYNNTINQGNYSLSIDTSDNNIFNSNYACNSINYDFNCTGSTGNTFSSNTCDSTNGCGFTCDNFC